MKREIKFRVWDKHYECFLPSNLYGIIDTDFNAFGIMLKDWNNYKEGEYFYENSQVLMQYTGLKDKNGKEIYEGDIVELVGGTCDFLSCGIYDDQKYKIGDKMIIQCLSSGFTLCGLNMYDCTLPNRVGKVDNYTLWNHARSLKIIGNIYENQNLLT